VLIGYYVSVKMSQNLIEIKQKLQQLKGTAVRYGWAHSDTDRRLTDGHLNLCVVYPYYIIILLQIFIYGAEQCLFYVLKTFVSQ
jgi:hypothetical protein